MGQEWQDHQDERGDYRRLVFCPFRQEACQVLGEEEEEEGYVVRREDEDVTPVMRELAYIFYVSSAIDLMDAKEISRNIDAFIEELKKNYVGKSWDLLAKETLAFCYIKKGDKKVATEVLETLAKTTGIPEGMLERTQTLLQTIGE